MNGSAANRSPELEKVRMLLFADLSPADGWARIDRALGRADPEQWQRIEALAKALTATDDPAAVLLAKVKLLDVILDIDPE
jgi:hypothetical protein